MEIPHEILHALELKHTFDPKSTYTFKKGATQNYMDYKDPQKSISLYATEKHYTYEWQWELARASKLIEKQLPLFSLLLFFLLLSCKTYKSVSCEYDYFPAKDEMILDSTLLNHLGKSMIRNNTKIRIHKFKEEYFFKFSYIDTLGIILNQSISYDFFTKNIAYCYYNLGGNKCIGKEYHFDEAGNITKVIDNDKGFPICWQQALFIAKKNVGKASDWRINKENYKGKNCWEVYYHKRRERFLLIDAQSGKIVKKGFSGIATDDVIYDNTF